MRNTRHQRFVIIKSEDTCKASSSGRIDSWVVSDVLELKVHVILPSTGKPFLLHRLHFWQSWQERARTGVNFVRVIWEDPHIAANYPSQKWIYCKFALPDCAGLDGAWGAPDSKGLAHTAHRPLFDMPDCHPDFTWCCRGQVWAARSWVCYPPIALKSSWTVRRKRSRTVSAWMEYEFSLQEIRQNSNLVAAEETAGRVLGADARVKNFGSILQGTFLEGQEKCVEPSLPFNVADESTT